MATHRQRARSEQTALIAPVVVRGLMVVTAAGVIGGCGFAQPGSAPDGPKPPEPTWIPVTPPARWPTPTWMEGPADAIDYAVALMGNPTVVDAYAQRTTYADIVSMQYGGYGASAPSSTAEAEQLRRVLWIVGLRLSEPLASRYLTRATGLGEGLGGDLYAELGGREVYLTLDDLGNPWESGYLDFPDEHGYPLPDDSLWHLEDIAALAPAPTPSATP